MANPWVWDNQRHRYRNTRTGRFLGPKAMLELRDRFISAMSDQVNGLARRLASGDLSVAEWEAEMRRQVKTMLLDQYIMARGGRRMMSPSDWGQLGQMLRAQYKYLDGFAKDIESGRYTVADPDGNERLSLDAIAARANLYMNAGTAAFERGKARSYGVPSLPCYPGDGSTACLTNCHCSWSIEETEDGWDCTWMLGEAEHCEDCEARAREYAPLHIAREE